MESFLENLTVLTRIMSPLAVRQILMLNFLGRKKMSVIKIYLRTGFMSTCLVLELSHMVPYV